MAFRVEISAQAERDADAILEWLLSQHTGQAGIDWFLALDDAFASLAEFPERCPIAPENARFNFEVPSAPLRTETSSLSHTVHHRSRHRTCPAYPARSTKTCGTNRIRRKGARFGFSFRRRASSVDRSYFVDKSFLLYPSVCGLNSIKCIGERYSGMKRQIPTDGG